MLRLFLAVAMIGLGACAHDLALPLDGAAELQVDERQGEKYSERVLDQASENYLAFRACLEDNRGGWQQYYASLPSDGVTVLPRVEGGTYTKSVVEAEYAVLQRGFDANP